MRYDINECTWLPTLTGEFINLSKVQYITYSCNDRDQCEEAIIYAVMDSGEQFSLTEYASNTDTTDKHISELMQEVIKKYLLCNSQTILPEM